MKLSISLAAFLLLAFSPIAIHSTSSARILLPESRFDNKHHDEESDDRFTCSFSRCSKYGNFVDWFEMKLESVTGQSAPRYCADHRQVPNAHETHTNQSRNLPPSLPDHRLAGHAHRLRFGLAKVPTCRLYSIRIVWHSRGKSSVLRLSQRPRAR